MLIFYCTDFDAVILGDDLETIEQISWSTSDEAPAARARGKAGFPGPS